MTGKLAVKFKDNIQDHVAKVHGLKNDKGNVVNGAKNWMFRGKTSSRVATDMKIF